MKRMDLNEVSERIQNNFKVLREKGTNRPLGVAYTEEGLKWISNKVGKALYFKNARFGGGQLLGDTNMSNKVYVEDFNPKLDNKFRYKQLEINWMAKANKMLYR